jgi:hypothetical protein
LASEGPVRSASRAGPYTSAAELDLTVYGLTIEGEKIHVQTKPGAEQGTNGAKNGIDAWFANRGVTRS